MPVSESRFVACLDCERGPRGKEKKDLCAAGWKARRRTLGCYSGDRIPGTKARKGEQGYVASTESFGVGCPGAEADDD